MDEQEQVGMDLNLMTGVFDALPHSTVILDSDFRVRATNRAFCKMFGIDRQETEGAAFLDVLPGQWAPDALTVYLQEALYGRAGIGYLDGTDNESDRKRSYRMIASRLESGSIDGISLLVTIEDISELGQVKIALGQVEDELFAEEQDRIVLQHAIQEENTVLAGRSREFEAFAYSVAHDLRAPLRTVHGFAEALAEDYSNSLDNKAKEYLGRILAASENMAQLIEDLLSLSRVSQADLTFEEVDLGDIVRELVGTLSKSESGRSVDVTIVDNAVQYCDTSLISIALDNLIRNAWKFTRQSPQAQIEFGFKDDSRTRVYFVRDNGVGFDPKYADKLFLPFHRLHSVRDFPGTGLGLSLVHRIITRHGGRIWAEAKENEGATFYFSLPDLPKDK
jgi:PAS domain S-box-containing protein